LKVGIRRNPYRFCVHSRISNRELKVHQPAAVDHLLHLVARISNRELKEVGQKQVWIQEKQVLHLK